MCRVVSIGKQNGLDIEAIVLPNWGREILLFINLVADEARGGDRLYLVPHLSKKIIRVCHDGRCLAVLFDDYHCRWKPHTLVRSRGAQKRRCRAGNSICPYIIGWGDAARLLPRFTNRFPHPLPEHPVLFPVGNMFWVKVGVVR